METTEYLRIENNRGESYVLYPNYNEFYPLKVEGLGLPDTEVNISESGMTDGGTWNSSHIGARNIVISLVLFGDNEEQRKKLYRIFPAKSEVTLYYRNTQYNVKTSGYVKHIDSVHHRWHELARIEIVCPDPYLHAVETITVSTAGNPPACTINNNADCEVGFTATVTVSTDDPPGITLMESNDSTETLVYPYQKNLIFPTIDGYSTATNKITELCVGGTDSVDVTENISSIETFVVKVNLEDEGFTAIHVEFSVNSMPSKDCSYTFRAISDSNGGSVANISSTAYVSTDFSDNPQGYTNSNINFDGASYDDSIDVYKLYLYKNGWEEKTEGFTLKHGTDWYAQFNADLISQGYTKGKFVVYHDSTGVDIRSTLQISEMYGGSTSESDWYMSCYTSIPAAYDGSKCVPYVDGVRIGNDDISERIISAVGDVTVCTLIDGQDNSQIIFSYVYAINGDNITEYTDEQIEAGLAGQEYVHGLKLTNTTTGEEMSFANTRFQLGDKIDISTVPKNLMYDIERSGGFIKLVQGDNSLKFTATDNVSLVSADFSVERLFGGV